MKYILTHSISEHDFKQKPFDIHDSIDDILRDLKNSEKLYILEVEEEKSSIKKFLFNNGISKRNIFKNHYMDSNKNIVKIVRKVGIKELLENEKASSDYFFKYAISNALELQEHSLKSLNTILKFLIEEEISPELLIIFCVRIPKCNINLAQKYITKKYMDATGEINTDMLIEFANKLDNCNINDIVKAIASKDNSPHCLGLLKSLSKITHPKITLDYVEDVIIEKDKKGNLIYELASQYNDICDIDKLSKALNKIDTNGYMCYLFATKIKGINKEFFQKAIAEKDKKGTYCISLASEPGYDTNYLLDRVIELDKNNGAMVIEFVKKNKEFDLDKALNYLLTHDKTGRYIIEFSRVTNGYNCEKICEYISKIDIDGKLSFLFALTVPQANIELLKNKILSSNKPELFYNLFANNINNDNKDLFFKQIKKIDTSKEITKIILENKSQKFTSSDLELLA